MRVALLVAAIQLVASTVYSQAPSASTPTRVVSPEGGFSVEMPCVPDRTETSDPRALPGQVVRACGSPSFYAAVSSLPVITLETPDEELDYYATLAVMGLKEGRLLEKERITFGRYPGRAVRAAGSDGVTAVARLYLVEEKNRVYQVMATVQNAPVPEDRIEAFFKSLAVLDAPAADLRPAAVIGRLATKINRFLPIALDQTTELLFTVALDGVFAYHNRMVQFSLAELDVPRFAAAMKASLTQRNCTQARMRDGLLKQGITIRHIYADKELRQIGIIDVTAADCAVQ